VILAFDIGGTKIAAGLIVDGRIVDHRVQPSVLFSDFNALIPTLVGMTEDWMDGVTAVHVATAGLVGTKDVHYFTVKPGLRIALHSELQSAFDRPVIVLNDAWAAAWGEFTSGDYARDETLVYLTVSTGIGGGIVADGQLLTGTTGLAAHLGHTTVHSSESMRCICGRENCAEAVASGSAIARRSSAVLGRSITAKEAIAEMDENPSIAAIIEDAAGAVAELMTNSKAMTDTHTVILGGSVGLNDAFRKRVEVALAEAPAIYAFSLKRPSLLKNAELVGAAAFQPLSELQ